jgi:hypothetical protein
MINRWEVFVSFHEMDGQRSYVRTFHQDEKGARITFDAYVGSDITCVLTNNGKLIDVYGTGERKLRRKPE